MILRRTVFVALATAFMVTQVGAVHAGGSWLEPTWVRVEAGEELELKASVFRGQLGWVDDGPFLVYLQGDDFGRVTTEGYGGTVTDVPLGELTIEERSHYLEVSTTVTIPQETPPGEYIVVACNDPCRTGLGDLIGAVLYVGMDPPNIVEPAQAEPPPTTAAVAVAATTPPPTTTQPLPRRLAIAPYPERPSDMSPMWIGISAALGGAVLLTALISKQRG